MAIFVVRGNEILMWYWFAQGDQLTNQKHLLIYRTIEILESWNPASIVQYSRPTRDYP